MTAHNLEDRLDKILEDLHWLSIQDRYPEPHPIYPGKSGLNDTHVKEATQAILQLLKEARVEELKRLLTIQNPYPEDIFIPIIGTKEWKAIDGFVTKNLGYRIDRVSGNLCRKGWLVMQREVKDRIEELNQKESK